MGCKRASQGELLSSSGPVLACPSPEPVSSGATIYYVATNESGASNDACDGLSPSDQGGGHCPFKDFLSDRTRFLLLNVKNVRVEVRAGTYRTGLAYADR